MISTLIRLSVIVPVYNAAKTLQQCLEALFQNPLKESEVIVVDDHSNDESVKIAEQFNVQLIKNERRKGPAAARNFGASHSHGEILFFVDSDVCVSKRAVEDVLRSFDEDSELAAVFGSYDTEPSSQNFLSQYKNLFHHYVHQNSKEEAVTFWAGCGAIRNDVFDSVGGFNEKDYPNPSIEDIELGLRLWKHHHRVRLEKTLQAKHLKHWTWSSLLKADIFYRAYPWSRLIVQNGALPNHLNLQTSHRISAVLVALLTSLIFFVAIGYHWLDRFYLSCLLCSILIVFAVLIILNRDLYLFFLKHRGPFFAFLTIPWHLFYYLYSGITFAACWLLHKLRLTPSMRNIPKEVSPTRNLNH